MLGFDFWAQLVIVLVALFYGARKGGMALGLIGGIGLIILVFGFHLKPGKPPVDVILTILSVICASAALQAAGGLDCLLQIAEKMLRKHRARSASSLRTSAGSSPFSAARATLCTRCSRLSTTSHQERHPSGTPDGRFHHRLPDVHHLSPAAVAAVSMIALCDGYQVGGKAFGFIQLFSITIPGALVGLFAISVFSMFRGKDLDKDEEFQKLIADPEQRKYVYGETTTLIGKTFRPEQWASLWIFLATVAAVAVFGMFPELRPIIGKKALSMTLIIQMFMLACGAFIVIFCRPALPASARPRSSPPAASPSPPCSAWLDG